MSKRYVIGGVNINDAISLSDSDKLNEIKDSEVMVVLTKENCQNYVKWHVALDELIRNDNHIVVLDTGAEKPIVHAIFMYMISNRRYDVYKVGNDIIDKEYADAVFTRKPDMVEVDNYFNDEYFDYNAVRLALAEIKSIVDDGDYDKLIGAIKEKDGIFGEAFAVFDYLKATYDKLTFTMESGNKEQNDQKIKDYEERIAEAENKYKIAADENKSLRAAAIQKDKELDSMVDRAVSKGSSITMYKTIMTSTVTCKASAIMYIKEITYATYTNTLVSYIFETLKSKKAKAKLLIYDSKNDFSLVYRPMRLIGTMEYNNDKESFLYKNDKFVIMEPNPNIITDMLKTDLDIIIVYDRLKLKNDIVSGNNVKKFWVVNSRTDYDNLINSGMKISSADCITRPDTIPESIGIPSIDRYASQSDASRISSYNALENPNSTNNEIIIRSMLEACGIQVTSRRK